jgi:hypothetical protein
MLGIVAANRPRRRNLVSDETRALDIPEIRAGVARDGKSAQKSSTADTANSCRKPDRSFL